MDLRSLRYFVAVAEERHVGRAAIRLHMTQPPLSRAIKQLENELGTTLLHRSSSGVTLTSAGTVLYDEARTLLGQAEQVRGRVSAAAGPATMTIGLLADSAEQAGHRLAGTFRRRHPEVQVQIREADFTDPTTGLRASLVDVALTRGPFDKSGISIYVLRSDAIGAVLRTDDPLAHRATLQLADLEDRRWFQFPREPIRPERVLERHDARRRTPRRTGGPHRAGVRAGRALERDRRADRRRPRPAPRAHRRFVDGHGAQPSRRCLEHEQQQPVGPLVRPDRGGELSLHRCEQEHRPGRADYERVRRPLTDPSAFLGAGLSGV